MVNAHVDISQGLDGTPVVLACFDLSDAEIGASSHAVAAVAAERYRLAELSAADLARRPGMQTVVLRPARLTAYRDAVAHFLESRDDAEWLREEDREPLALVRGLLRALEELCADALRAALSGPEASRPH